MSTALPSAFDERFLARVDFRNPNGCWEWTGSISSTGYGRFGIHYAHRVAHESFIGPIPERFHVDHLCRNPRCVNPEHLEAVTTGENTRRGLQGALKETCAQGHAWVPENIYVKKDGHQMCAVCARERAYRRSLKSPKREKAPDPQKMNRAAAPLPRFPATLQVGFQAPDRAAAEQQVAALIEFMERQGWEAPEIRLKGQGS